MNEDLKKQLNAEQVDAYLKRLKLEKKAPTLDFLNELIAAHCIQIPFEGATPWAEGKTPSLATDDLFEKIVTNKRGGYCFELNMLFNKLINALGYDAYLVAMSVGRAGFNGEAGAFTHGASVAIIDGQKYFVDVSTGLSPGFCLPLDGKEMKGHVYLKKGVYDAIGLIQPDGEIFCKLLFRDSPACEAELLPFNYFVSNPPDARFKVNLVMSKILPNGKLSVLNDSFRIVEDGKITDIKIESTAQLKEIAREYFGIPDMPVKEFTV